MTKSKALDKVKKLADDLIIAVAQTKSNMTRLVVLQEENERLMKRVAVLEAALAERPRRSSRSANESVGTRNGTS